MTIRKYYYFYGVRVLVSDVVKALFGMEKPAADACEDDYNDLRSSLHKTSLEGVDFSCSISKKLARTTFDFHIIPHDEWERECKDAEERAIKERKEKQGEKQGEEEVIIGICLGIIHRDYVNQIGLTPKIPEESLRKLFKARKIPRELSSLIKVDQLQYLVVADDCDCCS